MKKTLVALAVLAASGASFAQVTMTGELAMGYAVSDTAGTVTSGLGKDTAELYFAATEDLGGGTKATANMNLAVGARAASGGLDAILALSNDAMGTLTLATLEINDSLSGTIVDNAVYGWGGAVFKAQYNADAIMYSKAVGPVTLTLRHSEAAVGLSAGAAGSVTQRENKISADYAGGPLAVSLAYGSFDNKATVRSYTADMDSILTLAATYDLGVAKLGAGFQSNKMGVGSNTDTLLAVSVPVGALTLAAEWAQQKVDSQASAGITDGTKSGFGLRAKYALSKRTTMAFSYQKWDATVNAANASSYTDMLLIHDF